MGADRLIRVRHGLRLRLVCLGTVVAVIVIVLLFAVVAFGADRQRRARAPGYRGHTDSIDVQKYDRGYDRVTPS